MIVRSRASRLVAAAALPLTALVYWLSLVGRGDFGERGETPGGQPLFAALTVLAFMAAAAALLRTGGSTVGAALCVLAAAALVPEGLAGRGWTGRPWTVGRALSALQVVPVLAVALLHPRYRPRPPDVVALAVVTVAAVGAPAVVATAPLLPYWPVQGRLALAAAAAVPCAGVALLLVVRLVRALPVVRWTLAPVSGVGVGTALVAVAEMAGPLVRPQFFVEVAATPAVHPFRDVVAATLPAALLAGAVLRRAVVGRFGKDVLAAFRAGDIRAVQPALGRCLTDPRLRVLVADGAEAPGQAPADLDGAPAGDTPEPGRLRHDVRAPSGRVVAVLDVDARLPRDDPGLLATVAAAAAPGLENVVVEAALRARAREVAASRRRLLQAVAEERQDVCALVDAGTRRHLASARAWLERGAGAGPADRAADPVVLRDAVSRARGSVQSGLADLRLVARGVHPAVLGQSGLAAALRALPECLDVPVEVTVAEEVPHTRLRTAVEAAAYLAVVDAVERCADTGPEVGGRLPVRVDALIGEEMVVIAVSAAPDGSRPGPALSRVTADRVVALGGAVAAVAGDELTMRTVTVRIPVIG